ncbi:DNA-binding protein [Bacillus sp. MUM 116]|uniref:DeoR/GlpR family DNA-binding transcription regulator n=1 Tax=Bacillus sp. MUM 116 TaxID=1678002 RepID=UPI0008F5D694|nr:DeoR/GlpR family DNA-binding transcription regulator [Bacillus sp. MUM 116]OIK08909.1 DNA-binding protein [Bacillus sp. MUM 116]
MIKTTRVNKIKDFVFEKKSVSLDELVKMFNVSKNTIRRDIQILVDGGEIKKVYGGVAVNHSKLESFHERKIRNQKEKEWIAKKAAQFVEDGDIIFIDSGTTTIEMIELLKMKTLSIITNSLELIIRALPFENLNVISLGGILERQTNSFGSVQNIDLLKAYNINKAFMASTGISLTNGVTNASPLESKLKQSIVEKSKEVFLLVDHDKFNKQSLITYCPLEDINCIITDAVPEKEYQDFAKENNIHIVITNHSS